MLQRRASLLHWTREFFRARGYWEVETPLLSREVCIDAWIEPFAVEVPDSTDPNQCRRMYLQTSPEFAMKRLLAAGADAIFQITRSFRAGERGHHHNPEFTIVEWYRVGDSYTQQMSLVEELVRGFFTAAANTGPAPSVRPRHSLPDGVFLRLSYEEAFRAAMGRGVLDAGVEDLCRLAAERGVQAPASLGPDDRDGWLNLLLQECVEPLLATRGAVFLHDYPASQAALARVRTDNPPVAERFELYIHGVELCNGYQELTDPRELRERMQHQSRLRAESGLPPLPVESRLLAAMEAGLPESAGVALGFDRLLMTACGGGTLNDVLSFPESRA